MEEPVRALSLGHSCDLESNGIGSTVPLDIRMPGFRFHPTEEELVGFYLRRQAEGRPRAIARDLIPLVDLYGFDPWELQGLAKTSEKDWYFFASRDSKLPDGGRPNRRTKSGYWKATGTDKAVRIARPTRGLAAGSSAGQVIGLKKTLVFYKGRAPRGQRSDWIMNEYRLACPPRDTEEDLQQSLITLCKIYKKGIPLRLIGTHGTSIKSACTIATSNNMSTALDYEESSCIKKRTSHDVESYEGCLVPSIDQVLVGNPTSYRPHKKRSSNAIASIMNEVDHPLALVGYQSPSNSCVTSNNAINGEMVCSPLNSITQDSNHDMDHSFIQLHPSPSHSTNDALGPLIEQHKKESPMQHYSYPASQSTPNDHDAYGLDQAHLSWYLEDTHVYIPDDVMNNQTF